MDVAETLTALPWRSQIMDLANRLRMDIYDSVRLFEACDSIKASKNDHS